MPGGPGVPALLGSLGFSVAGRHRTKPVTWWRQGSADVVVNDGSPDPALGIVTSPVPAVASRAKRLLWPEVDRTRGAGEAHLPGITSPSGLHVFVSAPAGEEDHWQRDFAPVAPGPAADSAWTGLDHVALAVPAERRPAQGELVVTGARENNLRGIDVTIPVGTLTCVTGVSGSGKSTLVNEIILKAVAGRLSRRPRRAGAHDDIEGLEHFDKVIDIDQSPIGRTPRSNPATYTGVFDLIRQLFSLTPDARARGYSPGRFSFNVKGGRCEHCKGDGTITIEMHFLPDVYVPCEVCGGKRYNRETLEVRYGGRTIADILDLSIDEGVEAFAAVPKIQRRLQTLADVGLGYVRLGQPATTLSGGEAQRVKLASELSRVATGRTLYVLDEPTTGLHLADIERLLVVLQRLVDAGNTVLVIEHNLDVIKCADWIVDLGPEGGSGGGVLIAAGTPEQVAADPASFTGRYLAEILGDRPPPAPPKRGRRAAAVP